ncbi:MAG: MATE family efflux transporter [Clostridia bacterium]
MKQIQMRYGTREFLRYVLPSVASMLVFSLYSMVDGIFVAHGVGEAALAAVNLSMPFTNCIFAVAVLLAVGTSTVVAIHIGRGELMEARRTATTNTLLVAVLATAVSILTHIFLEDISIMLGATEETLEYVKQYLGIVSSFAICYMVSYCLEVLVKTDGYPQLSIVGVCSCCVTNIVLDYVFVMIFHWGIAGAAYATGIAQTISLILFSSHFLGKRTNIKPLLKKLDLSVYKRIIPLGIADFSGEISLGLTVLLFNRVILAKIGEPGLVSFAVISYVNTLVLMLVTGITQGMQPLVSLYFGKGEMQHCRGYYRKGLTTAAIIGVVAFIICQLFAPFIASLLLDDTSMVFDYTAYSIRRFSLGFLFAGVNICSAGFFTAIEQPKKSMTISLLRGIGLVISSMAALVLIFGGEGVWFTTGMSEALCVILTIYLVISWNKRQNAKLI